MDWSRLAVGSATTGRVHEVQDYGIVCDLDAHPDIVGLISTHQVCIPELLAAKLSSAGATT